MISVEQYSTLDFILDLREELRMHSEKLAQFLPERVSRYSDYWLSNLWGYSNKYVYTLKNEIKSKPNKKINDTSIEKLEVNLKEKLGEKAFVCTSIIKSYKAGELTPLQFLDDLRQELGRITSKIPVTLEELGLILVDSTRYIAGVWDKLKYPPRKNFNPNYMFTIERLEQFKENIKARFGVNANKCLKLIDKYKKANLNLKEYKNQQFTIKNPRIFQKLDDTEKLYWFGFLCADGWLIKETNRKYYRIGIELSKKDIDRIKRFTEFVGLPLDRIKYRIKYTKTKSGKITANEMVCAMFGCKLMYFDLEKKGLRDATSHTDPKIKKVPSIIYNLIDKAKEEALQGQYELNERESINLIKSKQWYYTKSGKLALAWLLGFFDGDGHYGGGRSASIASSSKTFLESVKRVFLSKNSVRIYEKSKALTLGPDLFDAMMWSYNKSMPRKRPLSKQGNNSNHILL